MIAKVCKELQEKRDVRGNLIILKEQLKEVDGKEEVLQWERQTQSLQSFLSAEDAKIRKNAALALGLIGDEDSVDAIFEAYEKEDRLFVKSSYLTAMLSLDCRKYSERLHEHYRRLCALVCSEEEKKHIRDEQKAMEELLFKLDGGKRHKFSGYDQESEVILTTNPAYREITARQIKSARPVLIPAGVKVKTPDVRELLAIRTFREMLFLTNANKHVEDTPEQIAKELLESGLLEWIAARHEGEPPFYFRIERKKRMGEDTSDFIHRLARCIEEMSGRKLLNSTEHYEVEIRLNQNKDGTTFPCVKLYTIPMRRFSYRRRAVSTSMHPSVAALLMQLAKPCLREGAQVLDPFCGVGTMLVERDLLVPAGDMYGTDIFGEAITGARENAKAAGMNINYIHRDAFDFTHKYLFDEIVTDMPDRGKKTREEQDRFYGQFFEKAAELLKAGGVMVMYSDENGFVKKHLRLRSDFYLRKEYCIREKEGYYLFIIGFKG